ncbi:MAG: hypothetical protein FWD61_16895 [Phycisphaerales bacterium]|nr:hypothetical protein [Phycisphaerales bacterium]
MTATQMRRELKKRIDHLPEKQLQSAASYLASLDEASKPFDPQRQEQVFANIQRIRERLANKGVRITQKEIRETIEDGRL